MDVTAEPFELEVVERSGVQSSPTVALCRDGEPVSGFVGAHPADAIGRWLDETLAPAANA